MRNRHLTDARWHPTGVRDSYERRRPGVGQVIAWDFRAWEVTHIADASPTAEEAEQLEGYVEPWRTQSLPYKITLRRLHGSKHDRENPYQEVALRAPARMSSSAFGIYEGGRVPLCSCHSHPWPCRDMCDEAKAAAAMEKAERELRLLPGCCPACQEPVTSRQKSITFGGPNVRNPLAGGPTFHLRRACRSAAASYEELWVADEPGRKRSLLTLACAGTVIVHEDGAGECFGADGSDCPSIFARHRVYSACYLQSHGCGSGCTSRRHGTRLAGYPSNPREVTR